MKLGFSFNGIASKHTNAAGLGPEDQRHQIWKLGFQGKKTLFSIFFYYQGPVAVGILAEKSTITGMYYTKTILPKVVQKTYLLPRTSSSTTMPVPTKQGQKFSALENSMSKLCPTHPTVHTSLHLTFCCSLFWKSLPREIRHIRSTTAFRTALKTHLFKSYLC